MTTGQLIQSSSTRTIGLADKLLTGITDDRFARFAKGADGPVASNHPAWVYGHLAIYAPKVVGLLGGDAASIMPPSSYETMFGKDVECLDDPDGSIYPAMEEITDYVARGYQLAVEVVGNAPEDMLKAVTPDERYREVFPTVGVLANFMLTSHAMFHLGQVSTWRRVEGLGSAM